MNKIVKITTILGAAMILGSLLGVYLLSDGVSNDDLPGQLIIQDQAPFTFQHEFEWNTVYDVYIEEGKEVEVEVSGDSTSEGEFASCEDNSEYCTYYVGQIGSVTGFQYVGELFFPTSGIYEVNFTMLGDDHAEVMILSNGGIGSFDFGPILGVLCGIILIVAPRFIASRFGKGTLNGSGKGSMTKTDYSVLANQSDSLEERFRKYERSTNYDSRIICDEGVVKITIGTNHTFSTTYGFLLVGVVCIMLTISNPLPTSAFTGFFALIFTCIGVVNTIRGEQLLRIHEHHLELLYHRMNFGVPEHHLNSPISDITGIHYDTYVEESESTSNDSDGTSTTHYHEYRVEATSINLESSQNGGMIWQIEIRSGSKFQAEELTEALNFLIPKSQEDAKSKSEQATAQEPVNIWDEVQPGL
tara:strand:- start:94 stop:1338 length:1245 start_codon:yes stop_codon:yes gene_type:complete